MALRVLELDMTFCTDTPREAGGLEKRVTESTGAAAARFAQAKIGGRGRKGARPQERAGALPSAARAAATSRGRSAADEGGC